MEATNFSEKNIENIDNMQDDGGEIIDKSKSTKIIFDYDQLDFIKFRLTFGDGFMFGLGLIVAWIMISIIMFLLLTIAGISFSHFLLRGLM